LTSQKLIWRDLLGAAINDSPLLSRAIVRKIVSQGSGFPVQKIRSPSANSLIKPLPIVSHLIK